ncbi:MAG: nucleotidyltransferase family protein [Bryobacteraceae bacterium]
MHPLIEKHAAELADLCRRLHVRRLDLFGSAAGRFDAAGSDLDFLVEFEALPPAAYADNWFALQDGLEAIFGRPIDLVSGPAVVNPYFAAGIAAHRETVYAG